MSSHTEQVSVSPRMLTFSFAWRVVGFGGLGEVFYT